MAKLWASCLQLLHVSVLQREELRAYHNCVTYFWKDHCIHAMHAWNFVCKLNMHHACMHAILIDGAYIIQYKYHNHGTMKSFKMRPISARGKSWLIFLRRFLGVVFGVFLGEAALAAASGVFALGVGALMLSSVLAPSAVWGAFCGVHGGFSSSSSSSSLFFPFETSLAASSVGGFLLILFFGVIFRFFGVVALRFLVGVRAFLVVFCLTSGSCSDSCLFFISSATKILACMSASFKSFANSWSGMSPRSGLSGFSLPEWDAKDFATSGLGFLPLRAPRPRPRPRPLPRLGLFSSSEYSSLNCRSGSSSASSTVVSLIDWRKSFCAVSKFELTSLPSFASDSLLQASSICACNESSASAGSSQSGRLSWGKLAFYISIHARYLIYPYTLAR